MTNIENIKKEIEQRETSIKEMEEKLKEAKKELKKFEKYRGLNFDAYHNYGGGKYHKGLARECFVDALRRLVLYMAGTTKAKGCSFEHSDISIKSTKDLNFAETKLCNDFLEEIYPLIEKYMDMFLKNKWGDKMYLDKKQVAERFGISVSTVNNYMREGMPFYKIGAGKLVRFVPEEVEKWIKERG